MSKLNKRKKPTHRNVPKTRKEIRKEKRLQKKENKKTYFSKKITKSIGELVKPLNSSKKNIKTNEKTQQHKNLNDDNESEIGSDFELSDDELNEKFNKVSQKNKNQQEQKLKQKSSTSSIAMDRFHEDQNREKKKQQELEKKMRKRRITQLKEANEEEDMIIRRLEKKLKIDKHKNEKSVHKMFSSDGLDYALELCLPENIEKMYSAAKEAAELEGGDDDNENDFEEDMAFALNRGKQIGKNNDKNSKLDKKTKKNEKDKTKDKSKKRETKLKEIEGKYFEDDFNFDSGEGGPKKVKNKKGSDNGSENDYDEEIGPDVQDEDELLEDELDLESETEDKDDDDDQELEEENSENEDFNEDGEEEEQDSECVSEDEQNVESSENNNEESENESVGEVDDEKSNDDGDDDDEGKEKIWEDIYGRKRDKHGNIIKEQSSQKYVPPHVRTALAAATATNNEECDSKRKEKLENLRRTCKGFLNRLSETNMHKISSEIENLYMKNSRYDMNNTMCKLIMEALIMNVLSKERLVLEHAMLIAVLHANIGNEIGAHFLQVLITKFDAMMKKLNEIEVEDKELDNILFIVSHLYSFKIFQHNLIFEIINKLIENLCEKSVECLLLILRSVGFQLRKDDPGALKELILKIQKTASNASSDIKENPRLKFMLDILSAIKNNNMNKIPNYDPGLAEHLKKVLKSVLVNGKYVATLNITLDDLLNVDEKGKWWVVGSAWSGNIKDIGPANKNSSLKNEQIEKFSEKLLELAKKQRMNTEDRKNVFCILMSAEDYLDAFEKLLHLSIKDHRVISSILIHCCLSEKFFNPYYAVLAQKFSEYDRKYQLAIQFSIWDRIKDIHSLTKIQIQNLAQFLIHLIINGGLPISVLKVIEFAELDKVTLRLVRQVVLGILLANEDECKQVFERIAPSFKLNTFKDSIRLFMHHFLLKEGSKNNNISFEKMELLKTRISIVDKILEFIGSRVKF